MCSQIVRVYGIASLKERAAAVNAATQEVSAAAGGLSLEEMLGDLDLWPPTSYEGLKAGFKLALSLAYAEKPLLVVLWSFTASNQC